MCISDPDSNHCRVYIASVEDALNLALQLEKIVLAQCDLFHVKIDSFLNDDFKIHFDLRSIFLVVLIDITSTLKNFSLEIRLILTEINK